MDNLLRILIVEDSDDDTQILLRELERGGYKPVYQRVETDTAMRSALDEQEWDIVLADYRLPHFSAPAALVLLKEAGPDIPFIVVSGAIGEETAVAVMKLGANDYVMKDNLPRLIPAVERELRDADVRREHRLAEERLKQAAQEWRTTFDSIADWVSIHDRDFKITRLNHSCAAAFGKHPRELIGRTCYKLIHGTDGPVKECPHAKTMKTGKPAVGEFYDPHMDCYLEVATSPVFDERGEVVASVHITRDITERKHMEGQLLIADRLASIGELSAGIAHEINNPLTSVLGFTELLRDRELPADVREKIDLISRETERASGIARNLLTFSRRHDEAKAMVNVNDVIASVLELRSYQQKVNNIEVECHTAELPEVDADYFRLQQVFLNIIINAEYFMIEAHQGGCLRITTELDDDVVRVTFTDDGPGIPEKDLGHLFDPFFTTKAVGKGTGLGLSICHGIVTGHGGDIYARSAPGKGATFVVELPVETSSKDIALLEREER